MLRSAGIDCVVSGDDVGGMRPDVGFVTGARLLVRELDEEDAKELIRQVEPDAV